MINKACCEIKRSNHHQTQEQHQKQLPTNSSYVDVAHFLLLPYKEVRADDLVKSMKETINKLLSEAVNTQIAYARGKLNTCFQIKYKNKFDRQHDLVYDAKYSVELCEENYIGESDRRIAERVKDQNGRDHNWHILKHSLKTGNERVKNSDFTIISENFNGNKRMQKIVESSLIKHLRPTLNIHDRSVPLKLFN